MFADSDRLRRFLRFTVESKLKAEPERVKEYVLGREVFDRKDDYDPRIDPIVRVEARRLRAKLQEYYSGPGRDEKIRVEYQRGSYLPVFHRASKRSLSEIFAGRQRLATISAFVVVVIGAGTIAWLGLRAPARSLVAVVPARWIEVNPGDLDAADTGLAEAVDSELANRRIAPVLAWPVVLQYQDHRKPLLQLAADMGAGKIVIVVVRKETPLKRISIFLIDRSTGQKLRASTYFRRDISSAASQQALAQQIANDLTKVLQT